MKLRSKTFFEEDENKAYDFRREVDGVLISYTNSHGHIRHTVNYIEEKDRDE